MATIERRMTLDGSISYRVKVRLRGQKPLSATFLRKTDASRWAQQTEADIRTGRYFQIAEAKKHTVAEAIDRYIAEVLPNKALKTQKDQRQQLSWWKSQLGQNLLSDVTPALLSSQKANLHDNAHHRSNATVIRYLAVLSHLFSTAVKEWQWLDQNPVFKISKPKEPRGRDRYLSKEELSRLLLACTESHCRFLLPVVLAALMSGGRKAEILNLKYSDLEFSDSSVKAIVHNTKNGDKKLFVFDNAVFRKLEDLRSSRRFDTDLVFPNKNGDGSFDIRRAWEKALTDASIENFRFHDLRHTTASLLAEMGASLTELSAVLGHRTLAMVKRYSHLSQSHLSTVTQRLNERILLPKVELTNE